MKKYEKQIIFLISAIAWISILPAILMLLYIVFKGVISISPSFIFSMPEDGMRAGGILPAIFGTIVLTIGTILVSVPLGVLTGVYLVEYSKDNWLKRMVNLTIINLAGIPSIVYGLFGMAMFVMALGLGTSIISGVLTLGIMCLPVIITATRESLLAIPNDLRQASLALGATKWETVFKIVLPAASPGIVTGIILSISRAAGETAPILFTVAAFYLPFLPDLKSMPSSLGFMDRILPTSWGFHFETTFGWFGEQVMALPYHLYVIATQIPNMPQSNIDGTVFILVFITVGFNLIGAFIRNKFRGKN